MWLPHFYIPHIYVVKTRSSPSKHSNLREMTDQSSSEQNRNSMFQQPLQYNFCFAFPD